MPMEPLKARWIKSPLGLYGVTWQCSSCWHATTFLMGDIESEDVLQFCPKCGAAMTEEADEVRAQEKANEARARKKAEKMRVWHYMPELPDTKENGYSSALLIEFESPTGGNESCIGYMDGSEGKWFGFDSLTGGCSADEIFTQKIVRWAYYTDVMIAIVRAEGRLIV